MTVLDPKLDWARRLTARLAAVVPSDYAGKFVVGQIVDGRAPKFVHVSNGPNAARDLLAAVDRLSQTAGANVYIGGALMRPDLAAGKKGGEIDVVAVLALVTDHDGARGRNPAEHLEAMPLPPGMVVETSPGRFQDWIFFDAPQPREVAKRLAVAMTDAVGDDPTAKDVSHVYRVPGTLNHPSAKKVAAGRDAAPVLAKLVSYDALEEGCTPAQLEQAIRQKYPTAFDAKATAAPAPQDPTGPRSDFTDAEIGELLNPAGEVADRSARFATFVQRAKARGYTQDEVTELAVQHGDTKVVERFAGDAGRIAKDVARIWGKATDIVAAANEPAFATPLDATDEGDKRRLHLYRPNEFLQWPEPDFLIDDVLPDRGVSFFYGASQTYKSFIAMDAALSVASGKPFLGKFAVKEAGPTVYCAAEAPNGLARKRYPAWCAARGVSVDSLAFFLVTGVPHIKDMKQIGELIAEIQTLNIRPRLVVLDTASRMSGGLDENAASTGSAIIAGAELIRRAFDCTVIIVDHIGKDASRGMRGASNKGADCDAYFSFEADRDSKVVTVSCIKQKDVDVGLPFHALGAYVVGQ